MYTCDLLFCRRKMNPERGHTSGDRDHHKQQQTTEQQTTEQQQQQQQRTVDSSHIKSEAKPKTKVSVYTWQIHV